MRLVERSFEAATAAPALVRSRACNPVIAALDWPGELAGREAPDSHCVRNGCPILMQHSAPTGAHVSQCRARAQ
jgi:hypothetical protein